MANYFSYCIFSTFICCVTWYFSTPVTSPHTYW